MAEDIGELVRLFNLERNLIRQSISIRLLLDTMPVHGERGNRNEYRDIIYKERQELP